MVNNYFKVTAALTDNIHLFNDEDPDSLRVAYVAAHAQLVALPPRVRFVDGNPSKAEKAHVCVFRRVAQMPRIRVIGELPDHPALS